MIVYVAGPCMSEFEKTRVENVEAARRARDELMLAGHTPICPHANFAEAAREIDDDRILGACFELVEASHAVVMVGDWRRSVVSCAERRHALSLGKSVFEGVKSFLEHGKGAGDDLAWTDVGGIPVVQASMDARWSFGKLEDTAKRAAGSFLERTGVQPDTLGMSAGVYAIAAGEMSERTGSQEPVALHEYLGMRVEVIDTAGHGAEMLRVSASRERWGE